MNRFFGGAILGGMFTVAVTLLLRPSPPSLDLRVVSEVVVQSCVGFPVEEATITPDFASFKCQSVNLGKTRAPKPPAPPTLAAPNAIVAKAAP